ncbi:hypothetical protein [Bradyrhizobium elkanii]|uniref:hypothetical protein n=1 Tax=Bradyrhizobium elkanii TaxID=29448 RepID=UPI00056E98A8|nr:hypothetical protein [Bradyrhizobium elkanii]
MIANHVSDIEFLEREVVPREHFLYVYRKNSGLLRSAVEAHFTAFAKCAGWEPTSVSVGATLQSLLNAPSWLGEMFFICDASDFSHEDLKKSLVDIAHGGCGNHVLLAVSQGFSLLATGFALKSNWVSLKSRGSRSAIIGRRPGFS